jgi:hypothetical protein
LHSVTGTSVAVRLLRALALLLFEFEFVRSFASDFCHDILCVHFSTPVLRIDVPEVLSLLQRTRSATSSIAQTVKR